MLTMNNITVWGQSNCQYCDMAKRLLDAKGLAYEYKAITDINSKKEFFEVTKGARSVPQIFVDGKLIGGYEQLKALINDQTN